QGAPALPAPAPAIPAPAAAPATPAAPADAVKPSAAAPAKLEAVPASAPDAKAPPPKLAGFAVQVGAFRDEAKLKQARDKLAGSSIPHYTERLESPGGPLTRLRAGPFATREAAEGAQAALKRAALDGKVVPLP
ncbi:MAG: SPOR domain-containing protein, partial [Pseudomonadota bacterium]|nr:SPOR domain-containing protein [Pseudomonadota bacterium]